MPGTLLFFSSYVTLKALVSPMIRDHVATETSVSILKWVAWRSIKKMDEELTEVPTGFFR
jgi:hypothetical protein